MTSSHSLHLSAEALAKEEPASSAMPRIVAFAKDWDDVPTCITHVFRQMGRTIPVLWLNSIGTRKPSLGRTRDFSRIIKRLRSLFNRAELKENQLKVMSLLLIPKAESKLAVWLNRLIFKRLVGRELDDMGNGPIEYWCTVPNAVDLLPAKGTEISKVIYYCVDDWSKFEHLDGAWLAEKEKLMLERADVVFTPSKYLEDRCRQIAGDKVHYAPHGVDYRHFASAVAGCKLQVTSEDGDKIALAEATETTERNALQPEADKEIASATSVFSVRDNSPSSASPAEPATQDIGVYRRSSSVAQGLWGTRSAVEKSSASLHTSLFIHHTSAARPADLPPGPLIGFYGNIYPWIDFDLLEYLVTQKPEWNYVMIGHVYCDISRFASYKNIHFLGSRKHDVLPSYCRWFDAAIIPYDMKDERMQSVNPVKAKELLSAGVPIVASDLPELRVQELPGVILCKNREEWIPALESQIAHLDRESISKAMRQWDWAVRVEDLRGKLNRL